MSGLMRCALCRRPLLDTQDQIGPSACGECRASFLIREQILLGQLIVQRGIRAGDSSFRFHLLQVTLDMMEDAHDELLDLDSLGGSPDVHVGCEVCGAKRGKRCRPHHGFACSCRLCSNFADAARARVTIVCDESLRAEMALKAGRLAGVS